MKAFIKVKQQLTYKIEEDICYLIYVLFKPCISSLLLIYRIVLLGIVNFILFSYMTQYCRVNH